MAGMCFKKGGESSYFSLVLGKMLRAVLFVSSDGEYCKDRHQLWCGKMNSF